jgi:glycogen debranching enzyme
MATPITQSGPTTPPAGPEHAGGMLGEASETSLPERIWQEASKVLGEVKVGPPVITINQGNTFMVTEENGDVTPSGELGFFAQDTRFISDYHVYVSGRPWELLTSTAVNYYTASYVFGIPTLPNVQKSPAMGGTASPETSSVIPRHSVALTLTRTIGDAIHDDYDLVNYHSEPVHIQLGIDIRADFADLFEVKSHSVPIKLGIASDWQPGEHGGDLTHTYRREDFERRLVFRLANADGQPHFGNGRLVFDITLQPGEQWHTCAYSMPYYDGKLYEPAYHCYGEFAALGETLDKLQASWRASVTLCSTRNRHVAAAWTQSVKDMGALRLYDMDFAPDVWLPAAGVPWFVTIFGRDSLIVSLQNMVVHPPFALGALKKLAEWQATEYDDWHDAEPGKILHELRFGEQAHFKEIPHTPYYGTADATILYLVVLHEAWRWMGQREVLQEFRPTLDAALTWIDRYGDLDGDGFQEYQSRSRLGYHNVGWKDAGDAVVYPDGSIVGLPIGLCELQGYVYDAKLRVAELMEEVYGEPERATALRQEAADLKRRFNERFWLPETNFYAYALDPKKELVRTVASNPGHLLWSGIADEEKAEHVVRRLMQPDMFNGWGIRTLSSRNPAYNPFEYQRGSVWPHDNAFIASGFKRYGFAGEANRIAHAIFEAAARFRNYQLPELFAGLPRTYGSFPVQYPGANIPQAWAAGSIFQFVRAMLGLRADAPRHTLYVNPTLGEWLPDIELLNVQVGEARLRLRFAREGEQTSWDVVGVEGGQCEVKLDPEGAPTRTAMM